MSKNLTAEMKDALASVQQNFEGVEFFGQWSPPAGTYNCLLDEVTAKPSKKDDGHTEVRIALKWRIVDPGDLQNQTFRDNFSTDRPQGCGPLFRLASLAAQDQGVYTRKDLSAALAILGGIEGQAVAVVEAKYTVSKKDGKTYANYNYNEVAVEAA